MSKLQNLSILAGAFLAEAMRYENVFREPRPTARVVEPDPERPSQRPVKIVPDQLHEFCIQGHKVMAKSRQDAIKRLIREGLIKDKKKKRKNK